METEATKVDGRHARSEQHKLQVVQALIELIRETGEVPTVEVLAERAQVSRRSVFRLFLDRSALVRATFDYMYERMLERFPFPDLSAVSSAEQIRHIADHLASVYEYISPFRRLSESLRHNDELIRLNRGRIQALYGDQIRQVLRTAFSFSSEPSESTREAIQMFMSWKAWDFLRSDRELSIDQAKAVVVHGLSVLTGRPVETAPD